jgi:hypothetical protein
VTSLEDGLRDAYRAVTDTVLEEELPGLYERRVRSTPGSTIWPARKWFGAVAPLAAAVAVLVAIGIAVALPKLVRSHGGPTAAPAASVALAAPVSTPPFVIVLNQPDSRVPLDVESAATGRTTAKVLEPRKDTVWVDAEATGSPTTFVLAAGLLRGGLCNPTYLYTLTLSGSGSAASLRPFTDPVVPAEIVSLAASADGRTVAFAADECRGPNQEIGIIRGGRVKTWQETYPLTVDSLSLSADGSVLGYVEGPIGYGHDWVRLLDTSSASGNATAASKMVYTYPSDGRATFFTFGADSTTLYVSWLTGWDTVHLTGYRVGPGGLQGRLFSRTMPDGLSLSRAGSQVLVWERSVAAYLVDPVTGKATRIRPRWLGTWGIAW